MLVCATRGESKPSFTSGAELLGTILQGYEPCERSLVRNAHPRSAQRGIHEQDEVGHIIISAESSAKRLLEHREQCNYHIF